MTSAYAAKIRLKVCPTNVEAQKINGSTLDIFKIVLANFRIEDKLGHAQYFRKTFLLANNSIEVILRRPFLTLNNADVSFLERKLT